METIVELLKNVKAEVGLVRNVFLISYKLLDELKKGCSDKIDNNTGMGYISGNMVYVVVMGGKPFDFIMIVLFFLEH